MVCQGLVGACMPCLCVERSSSSFLRAFCSSDSSSDCGYTLHFSQLAYFSPSSVQHPVLRSVLKATRSVCIPHLLPQKLITNSALPRLEPPPQLPPSSHRPHR